MCLTVYRPETYVLNWKGTETLALECKRVHTWEDLSIETIDDSITLFLGLHPCKAYTSAHTVRFSEYTCGDYSAVVFQHVFKVLFREVERQISNVQVGWVLLLLLERRKTRVAQRWTKHQILHVRSCKLKGSKCCWLEKHKEPFCMHPQCFLIA